MYIIHFFRNTRAHEGDDIFSFSSSIMSLFRLEKKKRNETKARKESIQL